MVEQEQDYKINVWDPMKRQGAIEMTLDGTLPDGAIGDLSEIERSMFLEALKADDRVYAMSIMEGAKMAVDVAYQDLEDRLPAYVPRDRTTKILLGAGLFAFIADLPLIAPIGETLAPLFTSVALARGMIIKKLDQGALEKILAKQDAGGYGNWPDKEGGDGPEI